MMSQVVTEELANIRLGVLSGPNLAGEIAERQLTGTVIAVLYPGVSLLGSTQIGEGCVVHQGAWIRDSKLGDRNNHGVGTSPNSKQATLRKRRNWNY